MLLSVVSLVWVALASHRDQDSDFWATWKLVQPSVVRLMRDNQWVGSAVMIQPSGFFVARTPNPGPAPLFGRSANGKVFPFTEVSDDSISGLALLQGPSERESGILPAHVVSGALTNGEPVLIVLANTVESGQVTNSDRLGIIGSRNRLISLSEFNLESATPALAGAPVFTYHGDFAGLLNANLPISRDPHRSRGLLAGAQSQTKQLHFGREGATSAPGGDGGFGGASANPDGLQNQAYGPSSLTVAYSVTPAFLRRVITGFLSASHRVEHPRIGLFVHGAANGGAYIYSVDPDSPAAVAGLRRGDVLFMLGGLPISDEVAYARALLHQETGKRIRVGFFRDGQPMTVSLTIGRARE
jgi:S1-C subfamily serine protease